MKSMYLDFMCCYLFYVIFPSICLNPAESLVSLPSCEILIAAVLHVFQVGLKDFFNSLRAERILQLLIWWNPPKTQQINSKLPQGKSKNRKKGLISFLKSLTFCRGLTKISSQPKRFVAKRYLGSWTQQQHLS